MSWSTIVSNFQCRLSGFYHLDPLPGDPFYEGSMERVVENAK